MLTGKKRVLTAAGMCVLAVVFWAFSRTPKTNPKEHTSGVPAVAESHTGPAQVAESANPAPAFPNTSAPNAAVARPVAGTTQGSGSAATVSGTGNPSRVTNPDGSTTVYIYGPDGRHFSEKTYDAAGLLKFTDRFIYDSQGNKLSVQRQRPDGFVAIKQMTYDASGNELKARIINNDGNPVSEEEWNR